jgi:preprotein translocase subunit SecD
MDGGVITGDFTRDEARILAAQLEYGALPLPLQIVDIER